jgi:general secretion pathway protein D
MRKQLYWVIIFFFTLTIHIPYAHADENTRITLTLQNADIRDVLQTIAASANVKMVIDTSVTGRISVQFMNTAFIEALTSVTLQSGYTHEKKGDVYVIGRPGQMPELSATGMVPGVKPLIYKLKYLKPDEMKSALGTVVPEDRIRIEPTNHALIISGTPDDYAIIKELLEKLDVAPKQIMFEAEVVEMTSTSIKDLGVKWNWSSFPGSATGSTDLPGTIKLNSGYFTNYRVDIDALVTQGKAKILANPRIAALDGQTARILIGDRLPVETSVVVNGVQQFNVNYVDVGIKLEITPRFNEDGIITTYIRPEVSSNLRTNSKNPSIRTREAETMLRVHHGQTIVIGGLLQSLDKTDVSKQPLLGDLPIIGQLFKKTTTQKEESELVIFITPKFMDSPAAN